LRRLVAHTAIELTDEPTALYRLYGASGELLYVGITKDLTVRFSQHAAEKWWWPQVASKTAMLYGSREDALEAEAAAILAESPVHNIAGRRDEYPAREGREARVKHLERKLADAKRAPGHAHHFDAAIEGWIDDCARDRKCTHSEAVVHLLYTGMLKHYDDMHAAYEVEMATLREQVAAREASAA
jgi:hypothetical protein